MMADGAMGLAELILVPVAGLMCAALILALRPLLLRHALARPNARSSHTIPTPQGGGAAVVAATLATIVLAVVLATEPHASLIGAWPLGIAVVLLMIVGAVDDMHAIAALPRLVAQAIAVAIVVAAAPADVRAVPILPFAVERIAEVIAGLWFVNLVNFMDGIDLMTVAETVPITAGIAAFAFAGATPPSAGIIAVVLLGAVLGFAPFNRPVAALFLGDVGSLPIGLILFWMLLVLAGSGHLAAALLLPLYYVADATLTLLRRIARGEKITEGHRTHFYQLATARGFTVTAVVRAVFGVNVVLAVLAAATTRVSSAAFDIAALIIGAAIVAALLFMMWRGRR
jgi:UDP-N-acetylmuramyl pentapeptide phosphotransferase/UDP-N-acetylglucosamine-1-phosphate transferase